MPPDSTRGVTATRTLDDRMAERLPVLTWTVSISRNGDVTNDAQTHGSTFAEVYRAFHAIKAELERQIAERRNCPFNPINGEAPVFDDEPTPVAVDHQELDRARCLLANLRAEATLAKEVRAGQVCIDAIRRRQRQEWLRRERRRMGGSSL